MRAYEFRAAVRQAYNSDENMKQSYVLMVYDTPVECDEQVMRHALLIPNTRSSSKGAEIQPTSAIRIYERSIRSWGSQTQS